MDLLKNIRVVLIHTTHPGNIGAAARAMGNMGLSQLYLVRPRRFPDAEASARATDAVQLLEQAVVVDTLQQAIADCPLVIGTTARLRSIRWPQLPAPEAMLRAAQESKAAPVALVFGRESRGLTNDELDRCNYLVRIPVDEACSSLNLASAVMVLAYELRKAVMEIEFGLETLPSIADAEPLATAEELHRLFDHFQAVMEELEFAKGNPVKLMRKLIRLFNRARPTSQEVSILRGFLTAVQRAERS